MCDVLNTGLHIAITVAVIAVLISLTTLMGAIAASIWHDIYRDKHR